MNHYSIFKDLATIHRYILLILLLADNYTAYSKEAPKKKLPVAAAEPTEKKEEEAKSEVEGGKEAENGSAEAKEPSAAATEEGEQTGKEEEEAESMEIELPDEVIIT